MGVRSCCMMLGRNSDWSCLKQLNLKHVTYITIHVLFEFWSLQYESHTKTKMKDNKCMWLFYRQSDNEPFFSFWAWITISCCTSWYKSATKIGSTTVPFSRDMLSVIFPPESLSVLCKWKIYMTIHAYFYNSHGPISLFSLVQNKHVVHFIKQNIWYIHIWYFDQRNVYRDVYVYTEFII